MRNLDELRWEQFHIGDIFSVERPSARNKDNYEDGDVPFVASGAINNGVMRNLISVSVLRLAQWMEAHFIKHMTF